MYHKSFQQNYINMYIIEHNSASFANEDKFKKHLDIGDYNYLDLI